MPMIVFAMGIAFEPVLAPEPPNNNEPPKVEMLPTPLKVMVC